MIDIEETEKKIKSLIEDLNESSKSKEFFFHQQERKKRNMFIKGGKGSLKISPIIDGYQISLCGHDLEYIMSPQMETLCGRKCDGFNQPHKHEPHWKTTDFSLARDAAFLYLENSNQQSKKQESISKNIATSFNKICKFRAENPPTPGSGIKTNDPIVSEVKKDLANLRDELECCLQGYRGFHFKFQESRGATLFPYVTHVSILPEGQEVSNGVYVVICFDKFGRGAVVGCAESKSHPKGIDTVIRKSKKKLTKIDVDGKSTNTRYNNVFANPREYIYPLKNTGLLISHIKTSLDKTLGILGMLDGIDVSDNIDAIDHEDYPPTNSYDARRRVYREIVARRGQGKFREALLSYYEGNCIMTSCNVTEVLEAAHIIPYNGEETNHITNGLLLRADVHTLFDLGLLSINPNTMKIVLSASLKVAPEYGFLDGKSVAHIIASKACLAEHFNNVFIESIALN